MAADPNNCTGGGCRAHLARAIPNRTCDRLFLAEAGRTAAGNEVTGNIKIALVALLLVWTFAAFGEEIAYRGYLLTRAADIGRRSVAAYWIGIVLVSILFGYGHYYKGASGIIDSGVAGLVLGTAYMLAGRNLWASIFAHGFIDTFGLIDAFFGWSN
jgi:CAAX protease family protein